MFHCLILKQNINPSQLASNPTTHYDHYGMLPETPFFLAKHTVQLDHAHPDQKNGNRSKQFLRNEEGILPRKSARCCPCPQLFPTAPLPQEAVSGKNIYMLKVLAQSWKDCRQLASSRPLFLQRQMKLCGTTLAPQEAQISSQPAGGVEGIIRWGCQSSHLALRMQRWERQRASSYRIVRHLIWQKTESLCEWQNCPLPECHTLTRSLPRCHSLLSHGLILSQL